MKNIPPPKEIGKYYKEIVFYNTAFLKIPSLYVTWLFLHTGITPTQITTLSGIIGMLGAMLFLLENPINWIFGWLFLNVYLMLDLVDGEVARIAEKKSKFGAYFDEALHPLLNGFVFITMSFGLYRIFEKLVIFVLGFSAIFFMSLLRIHNVSSSSYIQKNDKKVKRKDFKDYNLFEAIKAVFTELGSVFHAIAACSFLDLFFGLTVFRLLFLVSCGIGFPVLYVRRLHSFQKLLIEKGLE